MIGRPKKKYLFVSPKGEVVEAVGLKDFCQKHGLSKSKMSAIHRGIGKSHKGWSMYSEVPINETYAMRLSNRHKVWLRSAAKKKGISVELLVDEIIEEERRRVRRQLVERDYD